MKSWSKSPWRSLCAATGALALAASAAAQGFPEGSATPTADELRKLIVGKVFSVRTASGTVWRLQINENGYFFINVPPNYADSGPFTVEDGKWCTKPQRGNASCNEMRTAGGALYMKRDNGEVVRREFDTNGDGYPDVVVSRPVSSSGRFSAGGTSTVYLNGQGTALAVQELSPHLEYSRIASCADAEAEIEVGRIEHGSGHSLVDLRGARRDIGRRETRHEDHPADQAERLDEAGKDAERQFSLTVDAPAAGPFQIFAGVDCHISSGIQLHKEAKPILLGQPPSAPN